jgi:FkbM family methyltransferase
MPRFYLPLVNWIRRHPMVRSVARSAVLMVPDWPVTMNVPELGRFRFGLRRHRWLMGANCFAGHGLVLGMFKRLIRPGDVFYDVGANIGYYMRYVLNHFPVSRVVAFEPMRANVKILRGNVELGGCGERVMVLPIALGDVNSDEELQIDDVGDGSAVLDRISGGQAAEPRRIYGLKPKTERIEVRRLDDVIAREGLAPPNVMKIDTEGAERIVLEGALRTLEQHKPRLAIALHGPEHAQETLELLSRIGYVSYGMVTEGGAKVYRRLDAGGAGLLGDNNIISSTEEEDLREPIEAVT